MSRTGKKSLTFRILFKSSSEMHENSDQLKVLLLISWS